MFTMTQNVLRNLFTRKATRLYPYEVRKSFSGYRGQLEVNIDDCIFCGMCARKCPCQCIAVDIQTGKWECDAFACVYCGICSDSCPTDALFFSDEHRKPVEERFTIDLTGEPPKKKKAREAAAAGDKKKPDAPAADDKEKAAD